MVAKGWGSGIYSGKFISIYQEKNTLQKTGFYSELLKDS